MNNFLHIQEMEKYTLLYIQKILYQYFFITFLTNFLYNFLELFLQWIQ